MRNVVNAWRGLAYGGALGVLSFLAAGFGHGTYIPLVISSAPVALSGNVLVALVGAPVLWAIVCAIVRKDNRLELLAAAFLLVHYAAAVWLARRELHEDYRQYGLSRVASGMPWILEFWAATYLAGQIGLWWSIAASLRNPKR